MSTQVGLLIVAGVFLALVLVKVFARASERKKDKRGSHNNWRQNRKVSSDTSEDSGHAMGSGGYHGGGGGD